MRSTLILCTLCMFPLLACDKVSPPTAEQQAPAVQQQEATQAPAPQAQPQEAIPEVSVEDAAKRLTAGGSAMDANSERTREKQGTVPNAVILTSSSKYELAQLPKDKAADLIFYCANTFCTASDTAAERAQENGYEKVSVMREGIKGWKESGKPTSSYPQS